MLATDSPVGMSSGTLSQEASSPLELTTGGVPATQGISSRLSPEAVSDEPTSLDMDSAAAPVSEDHQQFYADPQLAPLQPQKLFDLNQLTEEEKIVLSASGSARLYQASSQDEIDAIMQQVLDSKTTDTVLIVSPVCRQIVTCNENGEQTITRVMTAEPHESSPSAAHQQLRTGDGLGFHGESPDNQQIPEPVLDYSSQHAIPRQPLYSGSGSSGDLSTSPSQSVIYEKHLTAEQIEMLNEQAELRKSSERDIQDMYSDQSAAHDQHLVYDSNNNPHDQLLKSVPSSEREGEAMGHVIDDKPQIDLIYGSKSSVFATPTGAEGQGKPLGLYATSSGTDLESFINSGNEQQQLVLHTNEITFGATVAGPSTVYVVQGMVSNEEEAMDLQSGIR